MRSTAAALLLSTAATLTTALPEISFQKRDRHTHGQTRNVARGMLRRDTPGTVQTNTFDIQTYSNGGAYYANVTVGTPPQPQTVILDTGSSDLYFVSPTSSACEAGGKSACKGGSFDQTKSSTFTIVEPAPAFNTSFGDGSTASGPYGTDTVTVSDVSLTNVQFGVADTVHSTTGYTIGLMGVGYAADEATRRPYPNIPEVFVDAGVINSRLYSVYLNDQEAISGTILFGGIDTDKYTGPLQIVDILPDIERGFVDRFISSVTDLSTSVNGNTKVIFSGGPPGIAAYKNTASLPVLLDTGSSAWSVDPDLYQAIAAQFPYVDQQLALCSNRYTDDSISVTFNAAIKINVPISDILVPLYSPNTNEPILDAKGEPICIFLITPSKPTGLGFQPIGDAVLRSMYIVYDLDNGQMGLAQAKVNSTSSSVKTVAAGPSGIARAAANVKPVGANNYSIAASAPATAHYSAVTGKTTVGGATGTAAVPANAQTSPISGAPHLSIGASSGAPSSAAPSGAPSSAAAASSSASSGAPSSTSTKKSSASGVTVPSFDHSILYSAGLCLLMAALGAGLTL